jgi:hypothetical protein
MLEDVVEALFALENVRINFTVDTSQVGGTGMTPKTMCWL